MSSCLVSQLLFCLRWNYYVCLQVGFGPVFDLFIQVYSYRYSFYCVVMLFVYFRIIDVCMHRLVAMSAGVLG